MSLTTLSRAALLPLTLSLNLNPLVSIAARTPYHQLQYSNLKSPATISSPFHLQCPSFLYSHSYSTMSTDQTTKTNPTTDNQQPDNSTPQDQQQQRQEQLALPDASSADAATQLDLSGGGSAAKLDHLGPMVVNTDGTLARITNWEHMTEGERQATLRVLGKRNKQRLEALKAAKGEGKDEGQS